MFTSSPKNNAPKPENNITRQGIVMRIDKIRPATEGANYFLNRLIGDADVITTPTPVQQVPLENSNYTPVQETNPINTFPVLEVPTPPQQPVVEATPEDPSHLNISKINQDLDAIYASAGNAELES